MQESVFVGYCDPFNFFSSFKPLPKAGFDITHVVIDDKFVAVEEEVALSKPFGNLVHFKRHANRHDPKVLLIAPLSGNNASLLRDMVNALLPHNDVYVTDWNNARDVAPEHNFDLSDNTRYVMEFIHHIGPNTHVVGISQSTIPAIAAISLMAQRELENQPLTLTLMGGPVNTTISQTPLNRFANSKDMDWFAENMIEEVGEGYAGHGRLVCSGRKLLPGLLVGGSKFLLRESFGYSAGQRDVLFSTMDLTLEVYVQMVSKIFHKNLLQQKLLKLDNSIINPSHVRNTSLLTIEGEDDKICGRGQNHAAVGLFSGIPRSHVFPRTIPNACHYGIFIGRRMHEEIAPLLTNFFREQGADKGLNYSEISPNSGQIPHIFKPS